MKKLLISSIFLFAGITNCMDFKQEANQELISGAFNDKFKIVESALKNGADVNYQDLESGQTALMQAARHGNFMLVNLLLQKKAEPNLKDINGNTALIVAAMQLHRDKPERFKLVIDRLLKAGADKTIKNKQDQDFDFWLRTSKPIEGIGLGLIN